MADKYEKLKNISSSLPDKERFLLNASKLTPSAKQTSTPVSSKVTSSSPYSALANTPSPYPALNQVKSTAFKKSENIIPQEEEIKVEIVKPTKEMEPIKALVEANRQKTLSYPSLDKLTSLARPQSTPFGERLAANNKKAVSDIWESFPSPIKSAGEFIKKIKEGLTYVSLGDAPVVGTLYDTGNVGKLLLLDKKIKDNTISQSERSWLDSYLKEQQVEAEKDDNMGYRIGKTVRGSVSFMAELGLASLMAPTTGGGSLAGLLTMKASQKTLKEVVEKLLKDKTSRELLTLVAKDKAKKMAVETALVGGLHTPEGAVRRLAGTPEFNDNDEFVGLAEDGQELPEAIINSITDNIVEVVSERSGDLFSLLSKPIKNSIIKASILGATRKENPLVEPSKIASLFKVAGWNGVVNEYLEERTGDVLRGALHVVGLNDQEFKLPTLEQSMTELASFALMGTAIKAIEKSVDKQPGMSIQDVSTPGGATFNGEKLYHVSDNPNLKISKDYEPKQGQLGKGFYVTNNPETWQGGQIGKRDYVYEVDKSGLEIADTYPTRSELIEWGSENGYYKKDLLKKPDGEYVLGDDGKPMLIWQETPKAEKLMTYKDPLTGDKLSGLEQEYLKSKGFDGVTASYSPDGEQSLIFNYDKIKITPISGAGKIEDNPTTNNLETSIKKAKASGQSFDEWVKGQGVVFHGSPSKFKAEELKIGTGQYGDGFYFAKQKGKAEIFAKKGGRDFGQTIEARVDLEKPFNLDMPKLSKDITPLSVEDFNKIKEISGINLQETTRFRTDVLFYDLKRANKNPNEILRKAGFDGIIGGDQIVAFTKNQIKTRSQLKSKWDSNKVEDKISKISALRKEIKGDKSLSIGSIKESPSDYYEKTKTVKKISDLPSPLNSPIKVKFKKQGSFTFADEKISSPADVAFAFKQLKNEAVEHFYAVGLKDKKPATVELISMGTLNASLVHPREVTALLSKKKVDEVYYIHNHPSGKVEPSGADMELTKRLKEVHGELGITYGGHIIIDTDKFGFIDKSVSEFEIITHAEAAKNPTKISAYKKYLEWSGEGKGAKEIIVNKTNDAFELYKGIMVGKDSVLVLFLGARNNVLTAQVMPKKKVTAASVFSHALKYPTASVIISGEKIKRFLLGIHSRMERNGINVLDIVNVDLKNDSFESNSWGLFNDKSAKEEPKAQKREVIKITDKETGRSMEVLIIRELENGELLVTRRGLYFPRVVTSKKFFIEKLGTKELLPDRGPSFLDIEAGKVKDAIIDRELADDLQEIIDRVDDGNDTADDIIPELSDFGNNNIDKAIKNYEDAVYSDRTEFGMRSGLPEQAEEELMEVVRNEIKKARRLYGNLKKITEDKSALDKQKKVVYTDNKISDIAYKNAIENGGVTINLEGGQPNKGYAFSPYKDTETVIPKNEFSQSDIDAFVLKNYERLSEAGSHLGIWEDNGLIYLDVSTVGEASEKTIKAAEDAGQLGVFDLENFITINTKLYEKVNIPDVNQGKNKGTNLERSYDGLSKIYKDTETASTKEKIKKYDNLKKTIESVSGGLEGGYAEDVRKLRDKGDKKYNTNTKRWEGENIRGEDVPSRTSKIPGGELAKNEKGKTKVGKYDIQKKSGSGIQKTPNPNQPLPRQKRQGIASESKGTEGIKKEKIKIDNLKKIAKETLISPGKIKVGNLINIINETTNKKGRVENIGNAISEEGELVKKKGSNTIFVKMQDIRSLIEINKKDESLAVFREKNIQPPSLRNLKIERPASRIIKTSEDILLKSQIRAESRAVKRAAPEIRAQLRKKILSDIKLKQGTVSNIKRSIMDLAKMLPPSQRGKLLATMKNVKTFNGLNRAEAFIQKIREEVVSKDRINKILRLLEKTKVKKIGGKPTSLYGPEVQKTLDLFRIATTLSKEKAEELIAINLEKHSETMLFPEELALENKILMMASGLNEMNSSELNILYNTIAKIEETGAIYGELKKFNRQADVAQWIGQTVDIVTGGKGITPGTKTVGVQKKYVENPASWGEAFQMAKRKMKTMGKEFVGWRDIMDMISSQDKNSQAFESWLNNFTETIDVENKYHRDLARYNEKLATSFADAYDLKNGKDVNRKMREDTEPISLGVFMNNNPEGAETFELIMTKAEARKRWMELQDPTLMSTFREGMFYTDEIIEAIEGFLTKKDIVFAETQLEIYQELYQEINVVYRDIFGVDLPFNPFYSPISRGDITRTKETDVLSIFNQEMLTRRSAASGALKSRVNSKKIIEARSDVQVLQAHVAEMAHFISWAKKVKDMNSVLRSSEVMTAIEQEYGKGMNSVIDSFLIKFAKGGVENARNFNLFDNIRIRFTQGVLAVKPSITVKQIISFPAYWEKIPIGDFVKGQADFWSAPLEAHKFLMEHSATYKARGENMDRDIKSAAKSDAYLAYRQKQSLLNTLMLNIKLGDKMAVAIGGWSAYKYYYNKAKGEGKSETEATKIGIREFEIMTNSTQQSAALADLSEFQSGGPIAKLFTMFASAPNLYFRKELGAIRNLASGRSSKKQFVKTIFIYHFLLPMFFQWVSDFGRWDEDEQKRAMFIGSFNGLFIISDGMDYLIRKTMGLQEYSGEMEQPIMSIFRDLGDVTGFMYEYFLGDDPITEPDVAKAAEGLLDASGKATGLPLGYSWDLGKGTIELTTGSWLKGLGELTGWSEYIVNKKLSPEKKTNKAQDKVFKDIMKEMGIETKGPSSEKEMFEKIIEEME